LEVLYRLRSIVRLKAEHYDRAAEFAPGRKSAPWVPRAPGSGA